MFQQEQGHCSRLPNPFDPAEAIQLAYTLAG